MHGKMYKLRSRAVKNGTDALIDLDLEFEGQRAFVIWDCIPIGAYHLKARLEIDSALLEPSERKTIDYVYHGKLFLPQPQNN